MKYAILSDIHGNLEALQETLRLCEQLGVDRYVCLGDIVGYGANPHECLQTLRDLKPLAVVKGNHDEFVSNGDEVMEGFNPHAKAAILWTKAQLSPEELLYLSDLPLRQTPRGVNFTIVHATLDSPDAWGYIFDVHHAADNLTYQFTQLCFCGHSHVPMAFQKQPVIMRAVNPIEEISSWAGVPGPLLTEEQINTAEEITLPIQAGFKYLVNVGSVGQPRNRDPRSSFAVFDSDEKMLTRYMLPYDIATAQRKIREAGLPDRLADRLALGN